MIEIFGTLHTRKVVFSVHKKLLARIVGWRERGSRVVIRIFGIISVIVIGSNEAVALGMSRPETSQWLGTEI